jgi:hypothetical protein
MLKYILLLLLTTNAYANQHIANDCKRPNWGNNKEIENSRGELCETNTRHHILYLEGTDVVVNNKCQVVAGKWKSFYSGVEINDPKNIQIDHVFPWAEMKKRGVCKLNKYDIIDFYNDRNNLVIATIRENQQKSDKLELPFAVGNDVKKEYKNRQFMFCLSRFGGNCDMFKL